VTGPVDADGALVAPFEVQPDDRNALEQNGFVRLRGLLPPGVLRRCEPEVTQQVIRLNTMHVPMAERSTYDRAFLQVMNLWTHSERVRELVYARRLAQVAAARVRDGQPPPGVRAGPPHLGRVRARAAGRPRSGWLPDGQHAVCAG
jgi:hypothetical protein